MASRTISEQGSVFPTPNNETLNGPNLPAAANVGGEVAALSNKLIQAINHQTILDDTLNATKSELDAARRRIEELERISRQQVSAIEDGRLIRYEDFENRTADLQRSLIEEQEKRRLAEERKLATDQELETLTAALFEEANQMVVAAKRNGRRECEAIEKRNEQVQQQLNEAEVLLASHQEQLTELKASMQEMSSQRSDDGKSGNLHADPTSPVGVDAARRSSDMMQVLSASPSDDLLSPTAPMNLSHLITPVLRTDLHAFEDFHNLYETSRRSNLHNRMGSGSYTGLSGLGLSHLGRTDPTTTNITHASPASNNFSSSSLSTSNAHSSAPTTPTLTSSFPTGAVPFRDSPSPSTPLKETAFYKRTLVEDIEPTLRLDTAPGLSWLTRRSVISSMCDGRLVIEPLQAHERDSAPACALCGVADTDSHHARTHRFKVNEGGSGQGSPLCDYCLCRVRATCDFLGFLRLIKDGVWRADAKGAEEAAWGETVRLRERMFWARVGGGVVVASTRMNARDGPKSPREDKGIAGNSEFRQQTPNPHITFPAPAPYSRDQLDDTPLSRKSSRTPSIPLSLKALPEPPEFAGDSAFLQPQAADRERSASPASLSDQFDPSLSPLTMTAPAQTPSPERRSSEKGEAEASNIAGQEDPTPMTLPGMSDVTNSVSDGAKQDQPKARHGSLKEKSELDQQEGDRHTGARTTSARNNATTNHDQNIENVKPRANRTVSSVAQRAALFEGQARPNDLKKASSAMGTPQIGSPRFGSPKSQAFGQKLRISTPTNSK